MINIMKNIKTAAMLQTAIGLTTILGTDIANATANTCAKETARYSTAAEGCLDKETGLIWGDAQSFQTNLAGAQEFCSLNYRGENTGWRLPRHDELRDVARNTVTDIFNWQSPQRFYWSDASPKASRSILIMPSLDANVIPEEVFEDAKEFKGGVVCVKPAFGCFGQMGGDYHTASGGCKNEANNLTWSKVSSGVSNSRAKASYCQSLRQGGHSNWRLPSSTEVFALGKDGIAAVLNGSANISLWVADSDYKSDGGDYVYGRAMIANPETRQATWIDIFRSMPPYSRVIEELNPPNLANNVCVH